MIRGLGERPYTTAIFSDDSSDAEAAIYRRAAELVQEAREAGVVLTITHKPATPLAMGHYDHEVVTQPTRVLADRIQR